MMSPAARRVNAIVSVTAPFCKSNGGRGGLRSVGGGRIAAIRLLFGATGVDFRWSGAGGCRVAAFALLPKAGRQRRPAQAGFAHRYFRTETACARRAVAAEGLGLLADRTAAACPGPSKAVVADGGYLVRFLEVRSSAAVKQRQCSQGDYRHGRVCDIRRQGLRIPMAERVERACGPDRWRQVGLC